MAEPTEMPFGLWVWMGPKNHVLDGGPDCPKQGAIFRGKDMPKQARQHFAVSNAKMAEPIEMPFALWTRVGPRKQVLHGVHIGTTCAYD